MKNNDVPEAGDIPRGLTDSHFHILGMERKGVDIPTLFTEMKNAGFAGGMDIGTEYDDFSVRREKNTAFPWIRMSVGAGPWALNRDEDIEVQLAALEKTIEEHRNEIHALGEIGLDYHWNYGTPEKQKALFITQLDMASRWNLPVVIHDRDAHDDIIACLKAHTPPRGGIMHCFSGDVDITRQALDLGFSISFACNVTYKNNDYLREAVRTIPLDRLLVETDSPYLAPRSERGRINTPLSVHHACMTLAEEKGVSLKEIITATTENFLKMTR